MSLTRRIGVGWALLALVLAVPAASAAGCSLTGDSDGGGPSEAQGEDAGDGALPRPLAPIAEDEASAPCLTDGGAGADLTMFSCFPESGGVGAWIECQISLTLPGGADAPLADAVLLFGGARARTVAHDDEKGTITVIVPPDGVSGDIEVGYGCDALGGAMFDVDEEPAASITSISPNPAMPGGTVQLSGANFSNASAVTFAGVSEDFVVVDDNTMIVQFDVEADSGAIGVTTASGTSYSDAGLTVVPATPDSGGQPDGGSEEAGAGGTVGADGG